MITEIQSDEVFSPSNINITGTAWTQTKLAITLEPTDIGSFVEVSFDGPVQAVNQAKLAEVGLLRGGTLIRLLTGVYCQTGGAIITAVAGGVMDEPQTTGPVTYTIAIKNDQAGGSVWFPAFGTAQARIKVVEKSGTISAPAVDQFKLTDNVVNKQGNALTNSFIKSEAGLTLKSSAISTDTLVLFVAGQSLVANTAPTVFTPVNSNVDMLSIYTGNVLGAKDPLIGAAAGGGNYITRLADKLVTDGKFARVIIVALAPGGVEAFDWSTSGVLNQRLRVACRWAHQHGWVGNANAQFGVIFQLGQQDAIVGTSSATWQAHFANIKASVDGLGCSGWKWFVPQDTMLGGATNSTIRAAQSAVVGGDVIAGWDMDSLTGTNRQVDNTHLSDAGSAAAALLGATVIEANY